MEKKKIINTSLKITSLLLLIISVVLLVISIYSVLMFFVTNSKEFQKINFENINEVSLFNPSILKIEDLSINSRLQILNRTYILIDVQKVSIPQNSFKTITFERFNFSQIQQDLINFSYNLLLEGKNESEIRSILEKELSESKIFGNIEINLQNLLKVSFYLETNLLKILKLS